MTCFTWCTSWLVLLLLHLFVMTKQQKKKKTKAVNGHYPTLGNDEFNLQRGPPRKHTMTACKSNVSFDSTSASKMAILLDTLRIVRIFPPKIYALQSIHNKKNCADVTFYRQVCLEIIDTHGDTPIVIRTNFTRSCTFFWSREGLHHIGQVLHERVDLTSNLWMEV